MTRRQQRGFADIMSSYGPQMLLWPGPYPGTSNEVPAAALFRRLSLQELWGYLVRTASLDERHLSRHFQLAQPLRALRRVPRPSDQQARPGGQLFEASAELAAGTVLRARAQVSALPPPVSRLPAIRAVVCCAAARPQIQASSVAFAGT